MKDLVILGSTGSIGVQALEIVEANPSLFRVVAITAAGNNPDQIIAQAKKFNIQVIGVMKNAEQIKAAHATLAGVRHAFEKYFSTYDFLILPAVPCAAPHKVDCTPELRRNILRLTAPASLGGLPVLSLPVSLPSGLTAGLQVILPRANSSVVPWLLKPE